MVSLVAAVALLSGQTGLTVRAGTSADFQRLAYAAMQSLSESQFARAESLAKRMPKEQVAFSWDDSKVPATDRPVYVRARMEAIEAWVDVYPELVFREGKQADIAFSFEPGLPPAEAGARNQGAVFFTSDSPAEPRIEAVLAYKRDTPLTISLPEDVRREVAYAIGLYLGLAPSAKRGAAMGRTDMSLRTPIAVASFEASVARSNIELASAVTKAANAKEALPFGRPEARIQPVSLDLGSVRQGDPLTVTIEVANIGDAELQVGAVPDCTCLSVAVPGPIPPGLTGLVTVRFDSTSVFGPFNKKVWVYSNDPERALQTVGVTASVIPRFRVLGAQHVVVLPEAGKVVELFVAQDPERPFKLTGATLLGASAAVTFAPWEGEMADPGLNEGAKPRKGYKVSMLVAKSTRVGRFPVVLELKTDDPALPKIQHGMQFQSGIVALPVSVYFGELAMLPARGHAIVSRPGQSFKVTGVRSDSSFVKTNLLPLESGDYKLEIEVTKDAPIGRFSATVTVATDDPGQPEVVIPVSGIVK